MNKQEKLEFQGNKWQNRIRVAEEYYKKWEKRFKCQRLEDYYEGRQWKEQEDYEPYVINLVFSSIQVKRPSLLFSRPQFHISPKPNRADFNPENAFLECQLKEDTLNTFVADDAMQFAKNVELAVLDSWFRFGIVEVGYSAHWIKNPNANKPILKSEYEPLTDEKGETLREPEELPEEERIYVKRIPAHRFRIGGLDSAFLDRCNWCGYYDFVSSEDLLGADIIDPDKLTSSGRTEEYRYDPDEEMISGGDVTKVWHIWDNRKKERVLLVEAAGQIVERFSEPFSRLPLFPLKFIERTKGWYPQPPVYNWKSPQDEINEAREMVRTHRRRFKRVYQAQQSSIKQDEMDKLLHGPDGTVILTIKDEAIKPVPPAPLDSAAATSMMVTKDDFNIISGTTSEQRGEADRTTATQANLTNARSSIREKSDQTIVAEWLCSIAKEILIQIKEKYSMPFWIQTNIDSIQDPFEINQLQQTYALVMSDALGSEDFKVNINLESMSPLNSDEQFQSFVKFLQLLNQFPQIALSPDLIREAAYRAGYRNEKIIKQMQQVAQVAMIGQIEAGQQNAQQGGPGGKQQMSTPAMESIRNQIGQQLQ